MKKRTLILIIISSVIVGAAVIVLCFIGLVYNMGHRLDCEMFNIDNVELRTQTDIPDLAGDFVCEYNEQHKTKSNFFRIDTSIDMHRYITRNHFTKISDSIPRFKYQTTWNTNLRNRSVRTHLYTKNGTATGEESGNTDTWLYILDSLSGEMWMELIRTERHSTN